MKPVGDYEYKADKGKMFVYTEKGIAECASFRCYKVGEEYEDRYATKWMVEEGYLEEVDDPEWIVTKGYKVVYKHGEHEICIGNYRVFADREMTERYMKGYQKKPWMREQLYIVEDTYEGKQLKPCREYEGKRVYNWDYWTYEGAEIGDLVEEEIVDDAINAVPPACMRSSCMQCGEPSDTRIDENGIVRNTYSTFKKVAKGIYEYCGNCFRGENVQRGKEIPYVA